ncbi:Uu.00g081670.m01.CDS01 [Anthostomella pinea]|uniref:Uu.00g081670.m01.CDS01 n=1 Tax=Anthostomella pinea TaxID=933095 RepID=A0AAI8VL75_9PEZI|nr:Uu.00g081670.m01.CDS01 [Anthostomella pinea]
MSHPPSTPAKIPVSAATYTPATMDPDLRSQINTLLLKDGLVTKIQDHLLHSLDAHNTNWPSAIQTHALALLRSGEVSTFPALMRRVLDDVRHDTATVNAAAAAAGSNPAAAPSSATTNNNTSSSSSFAMANANTDSATKNGSDTGSTTKSDLNGAASLTTNGNASKTGVNGASFSGSGSDGGGGGGGGGTPNLAIPTSVVEAVLKYTRDNLETVCGVDDDDDDDGTGG